MLKSSSQLFSLQIKAHVKVAAIFFHVPGWHGKGRLQPKVGKKFSYPLWLFLPMWLLIIGLLWSSVKLLHIPLLQIPYIIKRTRNRNSGFLMVLGDICVNWTRMDEDRKVAEEWKENSRVNFNSCNTGIQGTPEKLRSKGIIHTQETGTGGRPRWGLLGAGAIIPSSSPPFHMDRKPGLLHTQKIRSLFFGANQPEDHQALRYPQQKR